MQTNQFYLLHILFNDKLKNYIGSRINYNVDFRIFDYDLKMIAPMASISISWDVIKNNIQYPWCWEDICINENITWEIINDNPYMPWNYKYISENSNITWDIVKNNLNRPWNYKFLSRNPNITWEIIKNNPGDWDYGELIGRPDITWDIISSNLNLFDTGYISTNPNITWDIVLSNPNLNWSIAYLTIHLKTTKKDLINNPYIDYGVLSTNESITAELVLEFPDKPWKWEELSKFIQVTPKLFLDNNMGQYCAHLSQNPNITIDIVKLDPHNPLWDWRFLSRNPGILFEDIFNNDFHWDLSAISLNPNLTAKIVLDNKHINWDYIRFNYNNFAKNKTVRKRLISRKYFNIWRNIYIKNKHINIKWKSEFSASMDMIKLRFLDIVSGNKPNISPKFRY